MRGAAHAAECHGVWVLGAALLLGYLALGHRSSSYYPAPQTASYFRPCPSVPQTSGSRSPTLSPTSGSRWWITITTGRPEDNAALVGRHAVLTTRGEKLDVPVQIEDARECFGRVDTLV